MPRVNLQVPFSEKDAVKELGAKWDAVQKVWYVPDGTDPSPFTQWVETPLKGNGQAEDKPAIRCNRFCIVEGTRECWKCKKETRVFGFVLPRGYEQISEEDGETWERCEQDVILSNIRYLSDNAINAVKKVTHSYYMDFHHEHYWANHCEHCKSLQGDWFLFEEVDSPFECNTYEDAERLKLYYFDEPLEAFEGGVGHFEMFDMIELIKMSSR